VRRPVSAAFRRAAVLGILALAAALAATPSRAQSSPRQTGRPQPAPAPKVAPPQGDATSPAAAPLPASSAPADAQGAVVPFPATTPRRGEPLPSRPSGAGTGRGFVVVSAGAQLVAPGHRSTATFTVHVEDATLEARSTSRVGPAFAVRGGIFVWKHVAIGADFAVVTARERLAVTASLPHPFVFKQYRTVEGTTSGLERTEFMGAVEATWFLAETRRVSVSAFAGPAFFSARQDMASGVTFTEVYPYDTATFTGVTTTRVRANTVGLTSGADVAYKVSRRLGVGAELRYSYGSARLKSGGQSGTVKLGGLQLGVCAHVRF
jgi:hypothetical protein